MNQRGFGIILIFMILLVFGGIAGGAYYLYQSYLNKQIHPITKKTPAQKNPLPSDNLIKQSTSSGVNLTNLETVAFKEGSTFNGDVWISAYDGSDKKKITSRGNIVTLYDWSPSNKYILVSFTNDPKIQPLQFAAIEVQTGKFVNLPGDVQRWINNDEVVSIKEDKVNKISISGQIQELGSVSKDILKRNNSYRFNEDATKLAYDTGEYGGLTENWNIFVLDLDKKKTIQITNEGGISMIDWIGDQIIYQEFPPNSRLWISDPDGQNKKVIVSLQNGEEFVGDPTIEHDVIIYVISNSKKEEKVFMYNLKESKTSELVGKSVIYPSISKSLEYLVCKDGIYPNLLSYIMERETGKKYQICQQDCSYFVWSN